MSRIIFFVLIIAVIYFAWRSMRLKQIQLEKRLDKQEKANLAEHKTICRAKRWFRAPTAVCMFRSVKPSTATGSTIAAVSTQ